MAWLVGEYGPQLIAGLLPGIAQLHEWEKGLLWVDQFAFIALIAAAGLPLSQTPVLIICALLSMPLPDVFASVLTGKLLKYAVSATFAATTLDHVANHRRNSKDADKVNP